MILTADQIKDFAEITGDRNAAEATLRIAMDYHSNTLNTALKRERVLWEQLIEVHGLDKNKAYRIDYSGPRIKIEEKEKTND